MDSITIARGLLKGCFHEYGSFFHRSKRVSLDYAVSDQKQVLKARRTDPKESSGQEKSRRAYTAATEQGAKKQIRA
jgi:hypothetical protein